MPTVRLYALRRFLRIPLAGSLLWGVTGLPAHQAVAQEAGLPSFQSVLEELDKPLDPSANKEPEPVAALLAKGKKLQQDLEAFSTAAPDLKPQESAERWLGLFAHAETLQTEANELSQDSTLFSDYQMLSRLEDIRSVPSEVIAALPPPEHWPAIAELVQARPLPEANEENIHARLRDLGLRALAAILADNKANRTQLADEIEDLVNQHAEQLVHLQHAEVGIEDGIVALRAAQSGNKQERFTGLVDDVALEENLVARFSSSTQAQAQTLIASLVKEIKSKQGGLSLYHLARIDRPDVNWEIAKVLVQNSTDPEYWEFYLRSGVALHREEEVFIQLKAALAEGKGGQVFQDELKLKLAEGYVAANQTEQAQELLIDLASRPNVKQENASQALLHLVKQAKALEQPDLLARSKELALAQQKRMIGASAEPNSPDVAGYLQPALQKLGLRAEELQLLVWQLRPELQETRLNERGLDSLDMARGNLLDILRLYHQGKQHDQVLAMLQDNPYWGATDWVQTLRRGYGFTDEDEADTAVVTALHAQGQSDLARELLELQLRLEQGNDRYYELLLSLEMDSDKLLALFESLKQQDMFQERPWIWQAEVLRRLGKLPEAEAAIRKAISIDPSDGEQPHGDRMRAYAILAEILADRKQGKEAELYRQVVKAIRLSEHADDLHEAGQTRQAIAEYQAALQLFSDAYCIQSRLALKLAAVGRDEEAAEHYRKAFELMPDSFGRVESHCFGCEGAFRSRMAQKIAEDVFTDLSQRPEVKPQVHYLLAYLRMEQDRHDVALVSLRKAVEADPDYLNAWKKLDELATQHGVDIPRAERTKIQLQLLRLSPLERLQYDDLGAIEDLSELWNVLNLKFAQQVKLPDTLIPLPASARFIKENDKEGHLEHSLERNYGQPKTAGHALASHPAVAFCTTLINLWGDEE